MTPPRTFLLPLAHEALLGTRWPVDGLGTFVCVPGERREIRGIEWQFPPRWELDENHETGR
ncbi:hypothetical protein [Fimbriiglobus ruber]|uniref:hypothetical protein n=1 Tax=Fimbriiglobus ruber TaxID=1908690 RepID=UPI00117B5C20|nr:hypothetical protein [Fimbriiglobus ruber]